MTEELDTIRGILTSTHVAVLTTRGKGGALHSRPLALLGGAVDGVENFEGTLWFFTEDPSEKTDEIRRHAEVNVSVGDSKGYLSLSGSASIDRSQARIDELWNPAVEAWFPDGSRDPKVALIRIDVETAEYWDLDKPAVARVFEMAKALVTKTPPDVGESATVQL